MKILVASDGSEHSKAALRLLKRLPFPPETQIVLLFVLEPIPGISALRERDHQAYTEFLQWRQEQAKHLLKQDRKDLQETGWKLRTLEAEGHVADEITRIARAEKTDLVVVGSRGQGRVESYLLGSVTHQVVKHSPCSVLVGRLPIERPLEDRAVPAPRTVPEPLRILLALDNSPNSMVALRSLASLPLRDQAEVTVLTVLTVVRFYRMDILQRMGELWKAEKKAAVTALDEAQKLLQGSTPYARTCLHEGEDAVQEILRSARLFGSGLIVLGDKGESGIEAFLLGSVCYGVVQYSECSVLIVKGGGFGLGRPAPTSQEPTPSP